MSNDTSPSRRRVLLGGLTTATAALAGCMGGSNKPSGEVSTNKLSDTLTVTDHAPAERTILGTDAVAVDITLENTTSSEATAYVQTVFYQGDTQVGTDSTGYGGKPIPANTKKQVTEAIEGTFDDVDRYEINVYTEHQN